MYSIKTGINTPSMAPTDKYNLGRSRKYIVSAALSPLACAKALDLEVDAAAQDGDDLVEAGKYTAEQPVNWTNADFLDPDVGCISSPGNSFTQLYNLDAVACESDGFRRC